MLEKLENHYPKVIAKLRKSRMGSGLVELLIILALIATLAIIALPPIMSKVAGNADKATGGLDDAMKEIEDGMTNN